jgi:hypothetical protein
MAHYLREPRLRQTDPRCGANTFRAVGAAHFRIGDVGEPFDLDRHVGQTTVHEPRAFQLSTRPSPFPSRPTRVSNPLTHRPHHRSSIYHQDRDRVVPLPPHDREAQGPNSAIQHDYRNAAGGGGKAYSSL